MADKVVVPGPLFEAKETVLVLSRDTDSIGALLTKTDLERRQILESAIRSYVEALPDAPPLVPQRGDYVLARSELSEPKWCRALVLGVSHPLVLVEQVDYGYRENVRRTEIKELPTCLTTQRAFSVRLKVDLEKFSAANSYEVYIGNYVDDLQRTVEAFLESDAFESTPASSSTVGDSPTIQTALETLAIDDSDQESGAIVIPEDLDDCEHGCVRGSTVNSDYFTIYGVQHRIGFELLAEQLAQVELQLKPVTLKGDFVVVPYEGMLCRALVVEVGIDSARVYHVDFGSWDTVSLSTVYCLPAGPPSETPQLSFQCIVESEDVLEVNQEYTFNLDSVVKDQGYPIYVSRSVVARKARTANDLPAHILGATELVQLVDKPFLSGKTYGALVLEGKAALAEIESQLEEFFADSCVDFPNEPKVGDLVMSFIDGKFYRSVVCEASDAEIRVFQIDVGSFRNCSITVVMNLPDKLLTYPPVALLCDLNDSQKSMEPASIFHARFFRTTESVYGISVYAFEVTAIETSPDLGYATSEEYLQTEGLEYYDGAVSAGTDSAAYEQSTLAESTSYEQSAVTESISYEQSPLPLENGMLSTTQDVHCSLAIGKTSRATTPTSRAIGLTPRKLHHRTYPPYSFDETQQSFSDVKVVNVSEADNVLTLTVVLLDRQELLEEALNLMDTDALKPFYSSDLTSKNPGVMKLGESWVRVVILERPGPSSYAVQLVDYGLQTYCNVGDVYCCPPELVPIEMCTVECCIMKTKSDSESYEALVGQIVVLQHAQSHTFAIYSRESGEVITL